MVLIFTLPLLPVDETRYLTVAWEMRQWGTGSCRRSTASPTRTNRRCSSGLSISPGRSAEHDVGVARVIPLLITIGVLALTYRLARDLFPDDRETPPLAVMLTLVPVFYVYGSLLMFDQMLALWILLGLIALWRAAQAPSWKIRDCCWASP